MSYLAKALWYIESHYASGITLDDVALVGGASRCHLTRAFGLATGHSVMRYVRGRRLSEAARLLAQGAQDILAVAGIPALWQRFLPHVAARQVVYGVCHNNDDEGNFDYLCATAVDNFSQLPDDWTRLRIAPQRYAVFLHRGHISTIRATWHTIWNDWLPGSGQAAADAPDFERYDHRFDPASGAGGVEIWLPLKG